MKRTYYKVPIIGLQLLLFFSYIGFIFFYLYKLDKEVAFFDIPIKYTKSSISEQTYGISVTGSTGSTTVHFKSDSFPNKEFRAHYYKSLVFTRGFFRAIEKERLPSLGCYLEPSFLHSKEKEVPFFYSEQEKDIFYYLGLISYLFIIKRGEFMKKKDVKRYTKPIQQKIIIGVQLLIFFIYVGFLLIECYKTNNEVVFVNIPIKYNNEQCPTQDVGIRFTKGGKITPASMQFSSDKFPDKEFEVNNFDGVLFLKSIYWNKEERPTFLGCCIEQKHLQDNEREIPCFLSAQKKDIYHYIALVSYVKNEHIFFLITLIIAMLAIMLFFVIKVNYSPILFNLAGTAAIFFCFTPPIALFLILIIYFLPSKERMKKIIRGKK